MSMPSLVNLYMAADSVLADLVQLAEDEAFVDLSDDHKRRLEALYERLGAAVRQINKEGVRYGLPASTAEEVH